jgi:hypothetical protein
MSNRGSDLFWDKAARSCDYLSKSLYHGGLRDVEPLVRNAQDPSSHD